MPSSTRLCRSLVAAALVLASGCSTDRCVGVQPGRSFSWVRVPPPTEADRERAKSVPPEVLEALRHYLTIETWGCLIPPGGSTNPVLAVRPYGRYLLLDVQGCALDANRHLVYSPERKCIVGGFGWYVQG
jgi:hypothetical protein